MAELYLHQDIEGRKAGETIDDATLNADRVRWLIANGYASTVTSRETDKANIQTAIESKYDPTNPENPSAKTDYERPPLGAGGAHPPRGIVTPESFDPSKHTVEEVNAYLAREDIHDVEKRRVLAAERDGKNRSTVVGNEQPAE